MANKPEKMSKTEEAVAVEDSNNKNIEIEMTSNPEEFRRKKKETKQEDIKRPKTCDEDSYIVKLFKNLMNSQESKKSTEKKK
ncbi:hypothetical protein ALC62_11201 [Cyphomyrmex costatus]|uniref:Uncharacterized protein n=1 Tax=Cyphomyrmex costatus TaxID=456900 RepID=A0A195CAX3_9HYME|nr:hypothetical protein ALC62_11201 [Cyphomyrmex costatus]